MKLWWKIIFNKNKCSSTCDGKNKSLLSNINQRGNNLFNAEKDWIGSLNLFSLGQFQDDFSNYSLYKYNIGFKAANYKWLSIISKNYETTHRRSARCLSLFACIQWTNLIYDTS